MRDRQGEDQNRLPPDEAAYLAKFGGIPDPETGPGSDDFERLVAEQAAIDNGRFLAAEETARALGIDQAELARRVSDHLVLRQSDSGTPIFPKWQFAGVPPSPLPHLSELISALGSDASPFQVAGIMETTQSSLSLRGVSVSPREWLRAGRAVRPVLDILKSDYY